MSVLLATNIKLWNEVVAFSPALYDQQRLLQLALLILMAVVAARCRHVSAEWLLLPRRVRRLVGSFFVLGMISAVTASFPRLAFREVSLFACLVVTALVVASARRAGGPAFDQRSLLVVLMTALLYGAGFLTLDALGAAGYGGVRGLQMWGFDNPRFFGQVGFWIFPMLVGATTLVEHGSRRTQVVIWLAVGLWAALIVESASRSPLYAVVLATLAVLVSGGRPAVRWARNSGVAMLSGAALWVVLYGLPGSGSLSRVIDAGGDDSGRLALWRAALEVVGRHPVLGVGPEHWAHTVGTHLGSPHNVPLQLAAEWGLPAAAIAALLAAWGTWAWLGPSGRTSAGDDDEVMLRLSLGASIIAAGFSSLVEGVISSPVSQMLLVVIVGWMLGLRHGDGSTPHVPRRVTATVRLSSLIAVALLVVGALPYAMQPGHERDAFVRDHPGESFTPRFWLVGRSPIGDEDGQPDARATGRAP